MLTDAEKLKNFRTMLNIAQVVFCKKLGVGLSTVSMIESGHRSLSKDLKEKIRDVFNYDIDRECYITEKEYVVNTSNIVPVPFYHVKAAANPSGETFPDYIDSEAVYFDKRFLQNRVGVNPYNCSIIEVKGDSMDSGLNKPEDIKNGDLILIDNSDTVIVNNRVYVIEIVATNDLLIKRVFKDFTGKVSLLSDNPKYPPRVITEADNALIKGRVVWNGSKNI